VYNDGIHLTHHIFHPRSGDEKNDCINDYNQKSPSRAGARKDDFRETGKLISPENNEEERITRTLPPSFRELTP